MDSEALKKMIADLVDAGVSYALSLSSAIIILIVGFILAGWVARMIRRRLSSISRFDRTLIPVLAQIARYAILAFTLILVLAEFGVQTTSIIALLGAAGLAVGLALQGTLQNVAAGLMLIFIRPFRVGDYIEASGTGGTVDEIGLFMTRLHTPQGIFVAVPNSGIWSDTIHNYTKRPHRRADLTFGISYDDDIDKARDIIMGLVEKEERILSEPKAPIVIVRALGDSSVDLQLRAWTRRQDFWDVTFEMTRAVKYALDEAGVSIPYPHRQVVMTPPATDMPQAANDG